MIVGQFVDKKPRLGIYTKNEDNSWSWKTYLAESGFYGNGKNIINTADGNSVAPSIYPSSPGFGNSARITIPKITMSEGRPEFSSSEVTITMPSLPDLSIYATRSWVEDNYAVKDNYATKSWVNGFSLSVVGNTLYVTIGDYTKSVDLPTS
jgi:hypothetical protein